MVNDYNTLLKNNLGYTIMKKIFLILFFLSYLKVFAQLPDLAKTPPMGWNSWNAFGLDINSEIVKAVADSMVSKGLAAAGYQYIVIDDGWQIDRDKDGKIIADSTRFPEGIKYLADYVHSKGLKFGIYTCCGTKTCGGRPGSYGYENIDAKTYAEWGVDYIKEDWCYTDGLNTKTQYKIMSDAIRATGRPMLLSLCEWGISNPWEWAKGIGAMWRTTSDIQDCFDCVRNWGGMGFIKILEKNLNLAPFAGPGYWNDPDMLEVGNEALTPTECRSHFAMWCIMAAPLIAGNNISTMNDTIKNILTAPEIIAIDQDSLGIQGTRIRNDNGLQIWQKALSDGSIAVALLNVKDSAADMFVTLEEIGFKKGVTSSVRDLWNRKNLEPITDIFKTEVEPHGVVVVKIKGEKTSASSLKFEKSLIKIEKGNHQLIQLTVIPSITPLTVTSSNNDILSLTIAGVNTYKLTALKEGRCILKATTNDGKLSSLCNVRVLPSSIPSPWEFNEINDNKSSAVYSDDIFSIEGGGADIWSSIDQFAFVNRNAEKDNYISAQIISQTNTDPWAKTGLMFRESKSPKSTFVMLSVTPGNGISLQWRENTGDVCNKKDLGVASLPVYLKLSKKDSTFAAYKSSDGEQWELLGDITINQSFATQYLVGMEVCSHSSHMLSLSKFDHVKVESIEKK
jgi:alpha-galactosidase